MPRLERTDGEIWREHGPRHGRAQARRVSPASRWPRPGWGTHDRQVSWLAVLHSGWPSRIAPVASSAELAAHSCGDSHGFGMHACPTAFPLASSPGRDGTDHASVMTHGRARRQYAPWVCRTRQLASSHPMTSDQGPNTGDTLRGAARLSSRLAWPPKVIGPIGPRTGGQDMTDHFHAANPSCTTCRHCTRTTGDRACAGMARVGAAPSRPEKHAAALDAALGQLHAEGRYRTFIDIERDRVILPQ